MDEMTLCPNCEVGNLSPSQYKETIEYNGKNLSVDFLGLQCSHCGEQIFFPEQNRINHRSVVDAKRNADGLLTGAEIVEIRKRLNITQHEAATLFGGGVHAFSKYERGEVVQSVAMDRLLRLAVVLPPAIGYLRTFVERPYFCWPAGNIEIQVSSGVQLNLRDSISEVHKQVQFAVGHTERRIVSIQPEFSFATDACNDDHYCYDSAA